MQEWLRTSPPSPQAVGCLKQLIKSDDIFELKNMASVLEATCKGGQSANKFSKSQIRKFGELK